MSEPYVWDGSDKFYHSPRPGVEGGGSGVLHGDGPPEDGVTGVGDEGRQYMDDLTGVLYLNQGTLEAPVWKGVLNT